MARPYEKLPPGARKHLLAMAETQGLNEAQAATALGMPLRDFRRVIRKHEPSAEVWDEARAVERDRLLRELWDAATGGDTRAAQWLLAARHGVSDRPQDAGQERAPAVHIHLPAAMDAEQYARHVETRTEPRPRLEASDGDGGR